MFVVLKYRKDKISYFTLYLSCIFDDLTYLKEEWNYGMLSVEQPAYFHLTGYAASYRHTLRATLTSALLKSNFKKAA